MSYPDLQQYEAIGFDTETTGLVYPVDNVFAFTISTPDGKDFYFDVREEPDSILWFNDQMSEYKGIVAIHNAPFDVAMSIKDGFRSFQRLLDGNQVADTCQRAVLIDEHLFSYQLDDLAKKYLGTQKEDIWPALAEIFGGAPTKKAQIPNLPRAPRELAVKYATRDSRLHLDLFYWQEEEIQRQGIHKIVNNEQRWMKMFIRQKMRGIRVDTRVAERAADSLTPMIEEAQNQLNKIAGWEFNVNSTPQIKKLFEPKVVVENDDVRRKVWQACDGTTIGTTGKGEPSFKSEFLRDMKHPAAELILETRSLLKTRDTFLRGHVIGHEHGGRVYPNINQNKGEQGGTYTGRLSYTDPAMQQIPSRNKKVASIVKPVFLPEEGHVWVDTDLASFEVRIFAHLINVESIIKQYQQNPDLDFHQFVAELTGLVRNATYAGEPNSKQLNLSMIFNQGPGATAQKMGMEWYWDSFIPDGGSEDDRIHFKKPGPDAQMVIDRYHARIPGIKELQKGCQQTAQKRGYIFTRSGRRLRFPRGWGAHKASGLLIQATSADVNKENWEIIDEELQGVDGHLLLNTHDSYSFSFPEQTYKERLEPIKRRIEGERGLRVPLRLDINGVGANWWEALQGE